MIKKNLNLNIRKPLLLTPSGKDYLWGGQRINTEFTKNITLDPLAETWECSTHPDGPSFLGDGTTLKEHIRENPEVLGTRHRGEGELPVLIKFIDANADLSVQVHPDDEYAQSHEEGQAGKTEMWYVLDASDQAKIIYGFRQAYTKEAIRSSIEDHSLMEKLQRVPVHKNEVYFIPPGTVHAIGEGILVAEIQESSNLTYRLYDYDRVGPDGKKRPLHVTKALEVMDETGANTPRQPMRVLNYRAGMASELLSRCRHFEVHRLIVNTERRVRVRYRADELSFRVLLCIGGCGVLFYDEEEILFYKGDCIFVPADSLLMHIHGQAVFLEIRG